MPNISQRQASLVKLVGIVLCLLPIALVPLYNQGFNLPFLVSPLRRLTGIPCPFCGLTRSFMAILRGDWPAAVTYHLFGPVIFLAFLITALGLSIELATGRQVFKIFQRVLLNSRVQRFTLTAFLGYYVLRLSWLISSGELYGNILRSPLMHWLQNF